MSVKRERQLKILELIENHEIETQKELAEHLERLGYEVTQATVSRDIKELQLVKVPSPEGGYIYARPEERPAGNLMERARRLFRDSIVRIENNRNLLVIKTITGNANSVCAIIDDLAWEEIMGTLAGEDTILLIIRRDEQVETIRERIHAIMG